MVVCGFEKCITAADANEQTPATVKFIQQMQTDGEQGCFFDVTVASSELFIIAGLSFSSANRTCLVERFLTSFFFMPKMGYANSSKKTTTWSCLIVIVIPFSYDSVMLK